MSKARTWRRETDRGYALIHEIIGSEREGDGEWVESPPNFTVAEHYTDGSSVRSGDLSSSPTLEAAKRQFREWGFSKGKGRWVES
jgi:hypothetical protein